MFIPVIPATQEVYVGGSRSYAALPQPPESRSSVQVIAHKLKALNSNPGTAKKK
jgi:hypothetical protein